MCVCVCVCECVCVCLCVCTTGWDNRVFGGTMGIVFYSRVSVLVYVLYDLSACLSLGGTMGSHVIFSSCYFFVEIMCLLVVAWNHGNCVIEAVERLQDAKKIKIKTSDIGNIFS